MLKKKAPAAAKVIFTLYCLILVWVVLFKGTFSLSGINFLDGYRSVNLIPFYYGGQAVRHQIKETIMNIIVFVPFGLYLKMFSLLAKKTILYGAAISISFEIIQFVLAMGASDITDIIANTAGAALGACVYLLAQRLFGKKTNKIINIFAGIAIALLIALGILLFSQRSGLYQQQCHPQRCGQDPYCGGRDGGWRCGPHEHAEADRSLRYG